MENSSKWRNQAFCLRVSIAVILLWFAISFSLCMVFYFVIENEEMELFVINLSTWLFIIPSIVAFGILNTMPLITDWINQPLKRKADVSNAYEYANKDKKNSNDSKIANFNDTANIKKNLLEKVVNDDYENFMTNNNPYNQDQRLA